MLQSWALVKQYQARPKPTQILLMVQILLGYTIRVLPSRPIYLTRLSPPLFSVLRTHRSALCSLLSE